MQKNKTSGCRVSPRVVTLVQVLTVVTLFVTLLFSLPSRARAMDINMNFKSGSSEFPSYDPDGSRLVALMNSVSSYYEDIFENSATLNVEFYYDSLSDGTLAVHNNLDTDGLWGHPTKCRIRIDTDRNWFIDDTPFDNSEFDMVQTLARDISDVGNRYDGDVPDLLEYSYKGDANSSVASGKYDLWSVMLHEMGHGLGMTSACAWDEVYNDDDYDFNTNLVWGHSMAAECYSGDNWYHLKAATGMYPSTPSGRRKLPSATDLFSIAKAGEWGGSLDLMRKEFYSPGVNADMNSHSLWSGNWAPDSTEDAWVRHGGSARPHSADLTVNNLYVGGGSIVRTSSYRVRADHDCTVGSGSSDTGTLHAQAGGEIQVDGLLRVYSGSQVLMDATSLLDVDDLHINGGADLIGAGTIDIESSMFIQGDIITSGGTLTVNSLVDVDLDGSNGGKLYVTGGDFACNAALHDSISTYVEVSSGYSAVFTEGWRFDSGATVNLNGSAEIHGGLFRAAGTFNINGDSDIYADTRFESTADVSLDDVGYDLYMLGDTTINAGAIIAGTGEFWNEGTSVTCTIDDGTRIDIIFKSKGSVVIEENDIGSVRMTCEFDPKDGSHVYMEANGDQSCDLIDVNAEMDFDGTLHLDFIDGYTPLNGDSFTLFEYDTRVGKFDAIDWDGGFNLIADYASNALTLTVEYTMGDANGDGVVDGSDATLLANNWQQTGADWFMGDFNGDGVVDGSDATLLASNWQTSSGHPASVPEPSTCFGLLALLLTGLAAARRRFV